MLQGEAIDNIFDHPPVLNDTERYVIWTGGEPFENFTALEYGISIAAKKGFRSEVLSSGYWFGKAPERLGRLAGQGFFSLRISLDREHIDFTGEDLILRLTEACIGRKVDLNFTIRNIPGDNESADDLLEMIKRKFPDYSEQRRNDPRWIHRIPHVPVDDSDIYESEKGSFLSGSGCKMVFRDLVVGWDGNVYPCCGVFSLPEFENYSTGCFPGYDGAIWKHGRVMELFRLIGEKGPAVIDDKFGSDETGGGRQKYLNQCHGCLHLLKNYRVQIEKFLREEA